MIYCVANLLRKAAATPSNRKNLGFRSQPHYAIGRARAMSVSRNERRHFSTVIGGQIRIGFFRRSVIITIHKVLTFEHVAFKI